jgi:hypothetical protein
MNALDFRCRAPDAPATALVALPAVVGDLRKLTEHMSDETRLFGPNSEPPQITVFWRADGSVDYLEVGKDAPAAPWAPDQTKLLEGLAAALDDLLEEIDPDGEEHPDHLAALQRYRLFRLEQAGQASLDLHPQPQEGTTP